MSTGYIIALIILVAAIVILGISGFLAFKKVKPTLDGFNDLNKDVQDTINRYSKDGERIQQKIEVIQNRVELTQMNLDQKLLNVNELQKEFNSLSDSLRFLKEHGAELSKENSQSVVDQVKEDGPKYFNIVKGTVERTVNKQKARYS